MRFLALALAAASLSACGGNDVPSPAEREAGAQAAPEVDMGLIALHGDGLVSGAEAFYFAAGRSEVDAAVTGVLGEPTDTQSNPECGAGPMDFSLFPGGLTVNYQDGNLVGWILREKSDAIQVDADVAIGTPEADAQAVPGFALIEGSTLGTEFVIGDKLAGFIEDGEVSMLYAGTQCFFR